MVFVIVAFCLVSLFFLIPSRPQYTEKKIIAANYGLIEAERDFVTNDRLLECASNDECPKQADALFWQGAILLSDLETSELDLSISDESVYDERTEAFNKDTIYDVNDPNFKKAYDLLKKAEGKGSVYANNELGVIHLEQPDLRDLTLAKSYFQTGYEIGDAEATYNLARIHHLLNDESEISVLSYLRTANDINPKRMKLAYGLGLFEFGNVAQKKQSKKILSKFKKREVENEKDLFHRHFYLGEYAKKKPEVIKDEFQ